MPDDLGVFLLHGGLAFSGLLKKPTIGKSTGCFGQVGTPVLAMEDGIVPWIQPVTLKRHATRFSMKRELYPCQEAVAT